MLSMYDNTLNANNHLLITWLVISSGFYSDVIIEWILFLLAIGFLFTVETLDIFIKYLTDLTTMAYHKLASQTKNMEAATGLYSFITTSTIGIYIFIPEIQAQFFG